MSSMADTRAHNKRVQEEADKQLVREIMDHWHRKKKATAQSGNVVFADFTGHEK